MQSAVNNVLHKFLSATPRNKLLIQNFDVQKAIEQGVDLAITGALYAREQRKLFTNAELGATSKSDPSDLVSNVDKYNNSQIVSKLTATFPEARVIGEESVSQQKIEDVSKGFVFLVDPIDGTREYLANSNEWGILIGLLHEGEPVMGVVFSEYLDSVLFGWKDNGSYRIPLLQPENIQQLHVRCPKSISDAITFAMPRVPKEYNQIFHDFKQVLTPSSGGAKTSRMLANEVDLNFNPATKSCLWDLCATELVVREAGGAIVGFDGSPIQYKGTKMNHEGSIVVCHKDFMPVVLKEIVPRWRQIEPHHKL